jgi:PAS domain S-box-containing protein
MSHEVNVNPALFQAAIENSYDVTSLLAEDGTILYQSPAITRVLGYAPQDLVGSSVFEMVHPEDLPELQREFMKAVTQGRGEVSAYRCRTGDGQWRWIESTASPVRQGSDASVIVANSRDITDRRHVEEAMRHSEQLYQTLANNFPNGSIYLFDCDKRILLVGGQGLGKVGLSPEKIVGKTLYDVFGHDPSCEIIEDGYDRALKGEEVTFETQLNNRWRMVRAVPVRDEDDSISGVVAITQDVTERKQAEEEQTQLRQQAEYQHRHLNDILQNVPGIVWENSIDPDTGQQATVYVSNYIKVMMGYEVGEALANPNLWFDVVHPEDIGTLSTEIKDMLVSKEGATSQYRMVTKDGRSLWVETRCAILRDENGRAIRLRGVTMDITERVEAQREQSRLAALLESTSDLVGWTDVEGFPQYINPAGRAMLGMKPDEPMGDKTLADFLPPRVRDNILNVALPAAARTGSWSGESLMLRHDGQEVPVSQVITAHKDAAGNVLFYSTIARDISERIATEAALQRYNDELERRVEERTQALAQSRDTLEEQMAERQLTLSALEQAVEAHQLAREEADKANLAKSEFLSRMSHELRTPLNAILGFGQVLEMGDLPPKKQESVQHILKAGQHLLELINEVLDISRIESGHLSLSLEPVSVQSAVREVLDLLCPLAVSEAIELVNEIPADEEWHILADRQRISQVLINLVSNAIKYNSDGGRVIIVAQEMADAHLLRLEVRDTGAGLSAGDLGKLFTPFERLGATRAGIEGTGIGLVLSQRLVQAMGGQIGVESTPGEGSTFWIVFPLAKSPLGDASGHGTGSSDVQVSGEPTVPRCKILYIEDNLPNLKLIEMVLAERDDIRLLSAMQASTGLDLATRQNPNLILLDLHLPDINGDEVLRRLRSNKATAHIPVVMISADATPSQIERLLALGARDYLTKPLNVKQFISVLDKHLP